MKIAIRLSAVLVIGFAQPGAAADALDVLKGRPLTTVTYAPPDLGVMTMGAAGFGLLGGLAAQHDGRTIVRENAVPDPALQLQEKLTALLSARLQPSAINSITGRPTKLDDVASLSRDAGKDQVILDVETSGWMFMYLLFSPSRYRVVYVADARVIDAATAKRVARTSCTYRSDEKGAADL